MSCSIRHFCAVLALCSCLAAGCDRNSLPAGAVAIVNGHPIALRLVEARHDAGGASVSIARNPSVDLLRAQYGMILADLIVQELARQELEKIGLGVSDAELDAAEQSLRASYPPNAFEAALVEDNINIETWRELLRYGLVMQRFEQRVLRPKITIPLEEVVAQYKERTPEFLVRAHNVLMVVTGPSLEDVRAACAELPVSGESVQGSGVTVQVVSMLPEQIPEIWQKDIAALNPRSVTRERFVDNLYQCIMLKERRPTQQLSQAEAYPLIEQSLVERKLEPLFADWLGVAAAEATISVSKQLMPLARQASQL